MRYTILKKKLLESFIYDKESLPQEGEYVESIKYSIDEFEHIATITFSGGSTITIFLDEEEKQGNDENIDEIKYYERAFQSNLSEGVKYKYVVRKGKRIKKAYTDREGYKIAYVNGKPKEVRMSSAERVKRKKSAKKAARKPTKSAEISKRKRSLKKRTW